MPDDPHRNPLFSRLADIDPIDRNNDALVWAGAVPDKLGLALKTSPPLRGCALMPTEDDSRTIIAKRIAVALSAGLSSRFWLVICPISLAT